MISHYLNKYGKRIAYNSSFRLKKFSPENNLLIFGDARGGTTWLMELLSAIPGVVPISEPLHLNGGCLRPSLNFGWRQHIPKEQIWEEARINFEQILSGEEISLPSLRHATVYKMLRADRLLIKFARGNSLLPWLTNNFSFTHSPIYLLRHPIAVASSQIHNFPETASLQPYEVPDQPFNELFVENLEMLQSCKTRLEQLTVLWCIHNCQTLQAEEVKWQKIYYEDLVLEPKSTLLKMFKQWDISIPVSVFKRLNQPSFSDFNNSYTTNKKQQLNKWHQRLGRKELQDIQKILEAFHLQDYNAFESIPIT